MSAFCRLKLAANAHFPFLEALQNEPYNAPPFPAGVRGLGAGNKLNFEMPHVAERSDYAVAFLLPIDQ
ncbi:MAG TPA: hypothetical protein VIL28_05800 [Steroidobacteraceae bacterium]